MSGTGLFPGKQFISTVLDVLDDKAEMSGELTRRFLMRASMAGVIIGILYATNYAMIATFDEIPVGQETLRPIGRIFGAMAFGTALVFIYYSKSELLTSNMMIVTIGAYYRRIRLRQAGRLLGLCYLGNLVGAVCIGVPFALSTLIDGPVGQEMALAAEHKMAYLSEGLVGTGDLFMRAVLCNFMINLAMLLVYNGLIHEDLTKCFVMMASVFIFAFLGFEHSVANTVLFIIVGLHDGIQALPALGNIGVVLIGNYVGGGLLVGLYYAYLNDDSRYLRAHSTD
ncbi:MAG: formate/nitrite transporter family protein [Actinomycetales bacterium]